MEHIDSYFSDLTITKKRQFETLVELFTEQNKKVNMISRNDVENLEERHLLHSLAIAKFIDFKPMTRILDLGTGGGFPGLPLAIMFPDCRFTLVDSIGKKINIVKELIEGIGIKNTEAINARAETLGSGFDFIVSRAVAPMSEIYSLGKKLIVKDNYNDLPNGFILLKGGDLNDEKISFREQGGKGLKIIVKNIGKFFSEEFFVTKRIVYFPV